MEGLIGRVIQKQLADFREPSRAPNAGSSASLGSIASKPCPPYVTCYRCGSKGHYANECGNAPQSVAWVMSAPVLDDYTALRKMLPESSTHHIATSTREDHTYVVSNQGYLVIRRIVITDRWISHPTDAL